MHLRWWNRRAPERGGPRRDARIAVIGAGPAGVSVAHFLRKNGYPNVLVLEKLGRVGGLCCTIAEDYRCYDLGANYVTLAYRETLRLARELGLKLYTEAPYTAVEIPTDPKQPAVYRELANAVRGKIGFWAFLRGALRYAFIRFSLRSVVDAPDFAGIERHPELCVSFQQWLNSKDIGFLRPMFEIPITMMGYGYIDEIAAPYALRYMCLRTFIPMVLKGVPGLGWLIPWPKRFVLGFQRLWESLAWSLNVRLNIDIRSVVRSQGKVRIQFTQQEQILNQLRPRERTMDFDYLILACPLTTDVLSLFLDLSPDEQALFSKVKTNSYCMTTVHVSHLHFPTSFACVVPLTPIGQPWGLSMQFPETGLVQCYSRVVPNGQGLNQSDEEVQQNVETLLHRLGATIVNSDDAWRSYDRWTYFQHVSARDFGDGFYSQLAALQGQKNTFYVGGVTSFELIEPIVQFSKALVGRYFPPVDTAAEPFKPQRMLGRRFRPTAALGAVPAADDRDVLPTRVAVVRGEPNVPDLAAIAHAAAAGRVLAVLPQETVADVFAAAAEAGAAVSDPEEVLNTLTGIIEDAKKQRDRVGFFAALYKVMTTQLVQELTAGRFRQPDRMRRLVAVFAGRYLDAHRQYTGGGQPSRCWQVAFDALQKDDLLIVQHLLLAMNAHINYDLAIAVAQVIPDPAALAQFKPDYDHVNSLFSSLIERIELRLDTVSPAMERLRELGGRTDGVIAGFSIERARDYAWQSARVLQLLSGLAYRAVVATSDTAVAGFGEAITNGLLNLALRPIRDLESNDVPAIIDAIGTAPG